MVRTFFKRKVSVINRYLIIFIVCAVLGIASFAVFAALVSDYTLISILPIFVVVGCSLTGFRNLDGYLKAIKVKKPIEALVRERNVEALMNNIKLGKETGFEADLRYVLSMYAMVDIDSNKIFPTLLGQYMNYKKANKKMPKIFTDALKFHAQKIEITDYIAYVEAQIQEILKLVG
ncbi:MAG: hypothetical protein ACTSQK_09100 [Candidatus Heimdallarchaeota archaeon]